jgi:hypothetical protein
MNKFSRKPMVSHIERINENDTKIENELLLIINYVSF